MEIWLYTHSHVYITLLGGFLGLMFKFVFLRLYLRIWRRIIRFLRSCYERPNEKQNIGLKGKLKWKAYAYCIIISLIEQESFSVGKSTSTMASTSSPSEEEITLTLKWSGKEFTVRVCADDSVGELKRRICELTNVLPKRQKLLYPKVGSKLADDSLLLSHLPLKSSLKMTMIGFDFFTPSLVFAL